MIGHVVVGRCHALVALSDRTVACHCIHAEREVLESCIRQLESPSLSSGLRDLLAPLVTLFAAAAVERDLGWYLAQEVVPAKVDFCVLVLIVGCFGYWNHLCCWSICCVLQYTTVLLRNAHNSGLSAGSAPSMECTAAAVSLSVTADCLLKILLLELLWHILPSAPRKF